MFAVVAVMLVMLHELSFRIKACIYTFIFLKCHDINIISRMNVASSGDISPHDAESVLKL